MELFIEYRVNALVFEGKPGENPTRSRRCVPDEFIDHRPRREGVNEDEGSQKTLKKRICATPARVRVGLSCIFCGKRTALLRILHSSHKYDRRRRTSYRGSLCFCPQRCALRASL